MKERARKGQPPGVFRQSQFDYERAQIEANSVLYDPQPIELPDEILIARERMATLERLLGTLAAREERVIRLRCGIGCEPLSLDQLSELFGVCRERIRQIEAKGLRRLKHPYRSKQIDNQYFGQAHGNAFCNLYVPEWKRVEIAAQAEADRKVAEAERVARLRAEKIERQRRERELAWEISVREAQEREVAVERQLEKERQWVATAPLREARAAERERELRALAAKARENWQKDAALRLWAYAESQAAAAALRVRRPPEVIVPQPVYTAVFRRPIYVQELRHG
jgi:hypothetical protein